MKKATFIAVTPFEKMLITQIYKNNLTYREGNVLIFVFKGLMENNTLINNKLIKKKIGITKGYFRLLIRRLIKKNWLIKRGKNYYISNKTIILYENYLSKYQLLVNNKLSKINGLPSKIRTIKKTK